MCSRPIVIAFTNPQRKPSSKLQRPITERPDKAHRYLTVCHQTVQRSFGGASALFGQGSACFVPCAYRSSQYRPQPEPKQPKRLFIVVDWLYFVSTRTLCCTVPTPAAKLTQTPFPQHLEHAATMMAQWLFRRIRTHTQRFGALQCLSVFIPFHFQPSARRHPSNQAAVATKADPYPRHVIRPRLH